MLRRFSWILIYRFFRKENGQIFSPISSFCIFGKEIRRIFSQIERFPLLGKIGFCKTNSFHKLAFLFNREKSLNRFYSNNLYSVLYSAAASLLVSFTHEPILEGMSLAFL